MRKLKNRKTGAIFPYNKGLLRNKDMDPYDEEFEEQLTVPEDTGATSENGIIISRATKPELIEYAFKTHGVEIDNSLTVPQIRDQVKLLEEDA